MSRRQLLLFFRVAYISSSYCFANEDPDVGLQLWDAQNGARGNIALHSNPDLCLDAGNDPANGSPLKLWSCGDGWLQQTWNYETGSNLLALDNSESEALHAITRKGVALIFRPMPQCQEGVHSRYPEAVQLSGRPSNLGV